MIIQFTREPAYRLASQLVTQSGQVAAYRLDAVARTIEVDDDDLATLLSRIDLTEPSVLPVFGAESDRWLLAGMDQRSAGRAFAHVDHFLLPTYGALSDDHAFATFEPFPAGVSPLLDAIGACYAGGFAWQSPIRYRKILLHRLALWVRLTEARPELKIESLPSYAELLARFNSALAARTWIEAETALAELRRQHLCTAENLLFLRVQLFAQQERWNLIWEDDNYQNLAHLSLPRAVRAALITAFHHSILLEPELRGALEEAVFRFKQQRARLGNLLNGRFDLASSPVLRVFGYQALIAGDTAAIDGLLALENLDQPTLTCLTALRALLPPPVEPIISATEQLRQALRNRDYDSAARAAMAQESPVDCALAMLRIAACHPDAVRPALAAYDALDPAELEQLAAEDPLLDVYLERVLAFLPTTAPTIQSWDSWFKRLFIDPEDARLVDAADELVAHGDDREWTLPVLRVLVKHLETLYIDHANWLERRNVRRAVNALVDQFLADHDFPRYTDDYPELYSALYGCLLLTAEGNETTSARLLRLAGAVLSATPQQVDSVASDLERWFARPLPVLEAQVLDAFDLLIDYGRDRSRFLQMYREWIHHRLELPQTVSWPRTHQEVWLQLGEWIQPGDDVLVPLRQRLQATTESIEYDPIGQLPTGFRIGMFTRCVASAERARRLLLGRNADLDIRLCHETDMNRTVESLAANCDLAVVVADCLSHAIYYGISPLLQRDPVYPISRGTVSIVRAVEDFAGRIGAR